MLNLYSEALICFQLHQAKRVKCHTSPLYKTQCLLILDVSKKPIVVMCDTFGYLTS
jgi:hypothetical protein